MMTDLWLYIAGVAVGSVAGALLVAVPAWLIIRREVRKWTR